MSLNLYTYCQNEPLMYADPSGHDRIRDVFGEINGSVKWITIPASPYSGKQSFASVELNGLYFQFVVNKDDTIRLETSDGKMLSNNVGTFTLDRNNSNKYMDINPELTLGLIGIHALSTDNDNAVTAFIPVNSAYPLPMSNMDLKFRINFYNSLVESKFNANSYNKQMVDSVTKRMKEKDPTIKSSLGIETLLKQQQMYALNIDWATLVESSCLQDLARTSAGMGAVASSSMSSTGRYGNTKPSASDASKNKLDNLERNQVNAKPNNVVPKGTVNTLKFGADDLVYGPSAGGKLRQLQEGAGGRLLTDVGGPAPGQSWTQFSVQTMESQVKSGGMIRFDLTNMGGSKEITNVLNGSGQYANTVTGAELRYIQQNWTKFSGNVKFYLNGAEVGKPW